MYRQSEKKLVLSLFDVINQDVDPDVAPSPARYPSQNIRENLTDYTDKGNEELTEGNFVSEYDI